MVLCDILPPIWLPSCGLIMSGQRIVRLAHQTALHAQPGCLLLEHDLPGFFWVAIVVHRVELIVSHCHTVSCIAASVVQAVEM
jgi:hypothetical protein